MWLNVTPDTTNSLRFPMEKALVYVSHFEQNSSTALPTLPCLFARLLRSFLKLNHPNMPRLIKAARACHFTITIVINVEKAPRSLCMVYVATKCRGRSTKYCAKGSCTICCKDRFTIFISERKSLTDLCAIVFWVKILYGISHWSSLANLEAQIVKES